MDNFKIIYKILKALEQHMDCEKFPNELIEPETLGLSKERWARLMKILSDEGYVTGIMNIRYDNQTVPLVKLVNPEITLKGLEYLEENSLMKKAANIAKGIADIIP